MLIEDFIIGRKSRDWYQLSDREKGDILEKARYQYFAQSKKGNWKFVFLFLLVLALGFVVLLVSAIFFEGGWVSIIAIGAVMSVALLLAFNAMRIVLILPEVEVQLRKNSETPHASV